MSAGATETLPPDMGAPHVVILGAGASRAALPNGDKNGRKLPLMNDLIEVLAIDSLLEEHGLRVETDNFEALYSSLATCGEHAEVVARLEESVFEYFVSLELPDHPTLYDHLVLSLRSKDMIATFNWDPFLWHALCRNAERFGDDVLPRAMYLHGNVAIGHCTNHRPITLGHRYAKCGKCGSTLLPSRLLYPVTEKNYTDDPCIAVFWNELQRHLKHAYLFTVFGYRAPETDVEAVRLMREAWGDAELRELEQVEIIDIRGTDDLYKSWEPFICRQHYHICRDFYESFAAQHPRRSCDDFWSAAMQCDPQEERPIPEDAEWDELAECLRPLMEQERAYEKEAAAKNTRPTGRQ